MDIKNRRAPFKIKGGKDTTAELSFINGSAGAVFKNLNELQVAPSSISIKIPKEEADNIIQTMELSVKKLYEKRIITPETIKNINFKCDGFNADGKMLECMKRRMKDLQKRYFPDLKEIKLNDKQIISAEQKRGKSLQSAITQAQSSSKKDNPYMFKLCQEKQQHR